MLDGAGLPGGVARSASRAATPGASTFVDAALDRGVGDAQRRRRSATTRSRPGGSSSTDLAADNVLVVESVQSETAAGEWVHRSVDPSDKEVYVWTSFEPDDARRAWACFDQPDLKAPHGFTVLAPARLDGREQQRRPGRDAGTTAAARRWQFPDTPPLSTYVPVITAGPFHEIRSERDGFDLGLLCRQSLARFLDRDAEELFEVTAQGLAFFGDRFGLAVPAAQVRPGLPARHGRRHGELRLRDLVRRLRLPQRTRRYTEREQRAVVLLHEMAHMWFGDIVTMRWWEDLWLNEAFAEWACYWAAEAATQFTDAWSSFLASDKLAGYAADMAPTTHPIRQPVDDVAAAVASFDGDHLPQGRQRAQAAVRLRRRGRVRGRPAGLLRQARLGEHPAGRPDGRARAGQRPRPRRLDRGLARHRRHGPALARDAAGRRHRAARHRPGRHRAAPAPARHRRLRPGTTARRWCAGSWSRSRRPASTTDVPDVANAALLLVNDEDLTFASVRPDASSLQTMLDSAAQLPSAVSRAVAVTTAWDMLVWGELAAADFVRCVTAVLPDEPVDSVVEPYLSLAVEAADSWSPDAAPRRPARAGRRRLPAARRQPGAAAGRPARAGPDRRHRPTRSPRCASWSATTSTCAGAC